MRDLSPDMVTAIRSNRVKPAVLVYIDTAAGPVRAWTGIGSITWNGDVYIGVGDLGGIGEVAETSDLQATGCRFSLAGVVEENVRIALQDIRQGLEARIYLGMLDPVFALYADPYMVFKGVTDVPEIDEAGEVSNVILSAESRLVSLERSIDRRYTTKDQQLDDPTDLGFEFVPGLQDAVIRFGA